MTKRSFLAILGTCVLILIGWFIFSSKYVSWDFRNNLWAPAYLLTHGESPYRIAILFKESTAVWFPQIIGLFFPLGFLSQSHASSIWLIINLSALTGMTIYLVQQSGGKKPTPITFGIILLGVLFFPASLTHLFLGQVDLLLIAALLTSAAAIGSRNYLAAALCFAFALTKPQICFLTLPGFFISIILTRKWKSALLTAALTIGFAVIMTMPLWIFDPKWSKDFLWNLQALPIWWQPTLLYLLKGEFGRPGSFIWLLIASACVVGSTILWKNLPPRQALLWSLALTTLAAPYLWSWDFTLLLPLFIDTAARSTKIYTRLILFLSWAGCLFLSIWTHQFEDGDNRMWWLPLVMLIGMGLCLVLEKKNLRISPGRVNENTKRN